MSLQTSWIAGTVIPLVVLRDGCTPLAKPRKQWRDHAGAILGMATQHRPFRFVWRRRFVEQRRGHLELADIVQKSSPPQPHPIFLRQPKLFREQIGEDPDTLGMPAAGSVVDTECQHELDDRFQILRMIDLARGVRGFHPVAQLARRSRAPCDREPRRRLVGKEQ